MEKRVTVKVKQEHNPIFCELHLLSGVMCSILCECTTSTIVTINVWAKRFIRGKEGCKTGEKYHELFRIQRFHHATCSHWKVYSFQSIYPTMTIVHLCCFHLSDKQPSSICNNCSIFLSFYRTLSHIRRWPKSRNRNSNSPRSILSIWRNIVSIFK